MEGDGGGGRPARQRPTEEPGHTRPPRFRSAPCSGALDSGPPAAPSHRSRRLSKPEEGQKEYPFDPRKEGGAEKFIQDSGLQSSVREPSEPSSCEPVTPGYQGVALELGQPPADQYVQAQQFSETSPSHQATLSVWGPRGSPESQVAGALGDTQTEPSLDQVVRERDEAIAKKRAVEAELDIFKAKLRAVEAQLLEVLEEKLRLKQEVEAWEDDMQWMVRQQVESQLQRESRGALGAPMDPGTARIPWVRFPLRWWGRWR
uniref:BICD family-like cargo adapter 1 n=1 Tax=Tursiops truncatus TaxID=9739 RepID=A0A6J3Q197_TURTR|nr:BICD family-like cargo adapter 1 [Tursiops truncatus]